MNLNLIEGAAKSAYLSSLDKRLAYSCAVSLKRIADMLESGSLFTQHEISCGESLTDSIHMAFVRGQQGNDRV